MRQSPEVEAILSRPIFLILGDLRSFNRGCFRAAHKPIFECVSVYIYLTILLSFSMPINATLVDNYIPIFQEKVATITGAAELDRIIQDINSRFTPKPPHATRFYFVRHGLSTANKYRYFAGHSNVYWENEVSHPIVLTEEGIAQALSRASAILSEQQDENWQFSAAFCSSTLRAQETTQHILQGIRQTDISVQIDDLVIERSNGKLEGTKKDAGWLIEEKKYDNYVSSLDTILEKFQAKYDPKDDKEENLLQVFTRMINFLPEKAANPDLKNKHILVVSHAYSTRVLFIAEVARKYNLNIEESNLQSINGSVLILDVYENDHIELVKTLGFSYKQ